MVKTTLRVSFIMEIETDSEPSAEEKRQTIETLKLAIQMNKGISGVTIEEVETVN